MQSLKITKMELIHSPESVEAIQQWIDLHPPKDRAAMLTVMGMTWNFLADMVAMHNEFGGDAVSDGSILDDEPTDPPVPVKPVISRAYHTLLVAYNNEPWCADFGSYSYNEVLGEAEGLDTDTVYMVITTDHDQAAIDAEIKRLIDGGPMYV